MKKLITIKTNDTVYRYGPMCTWIKVTLDSTNTILKVSGKDENKKSFRVFFPIENVISWSIEEV